MIITQSCNIEISTMILIFKWYTNFSCAFMLQTCNIQISKTYLVLSILRTYNTRISNGNRIETLSSLTCTKPSSTIHMYNNHPISPAFTTGTIEILQINISASLELLQCKYQILPFYNKRPR